jgi:hypothetical protein
MFAFLTLLLLLGCWERSSIDDELSPYGCLSSHTEVQSQLRQSMIVDCAADETAELRPADVRIALSAVESARLYELSGGVRADLRADDFPLVERALKSHDNEDRKLACGAIEKFCYMLDYSGFPKDLRHAGRLTQVSLNRAYTDRNFPYLIDAANAKSPAVSELGGRAIGALAAYSELLSPDEVATTCKTVLASLRSSDFEDRRRGVNLLADLMKRLDPNSSQEQQAVALLLDAAEEWQRSQRLSWDAWTDAVSARGTAKIRFQAQALNALLHNCDAIADNTKALRAYRFLSKGLANGSLDLQAVVAIAGVASRLPRAERDNAVRLALAGIPDKSFWHDVGSGRVMLRNYAADALVSLAPCLNRDETDKALQAIDAQQLNRSRKRVFQPAVTALRDRLTQLR